MKPDGEVERRDPCPLSSSHHQSGTHHTSIHR